MSELEEISKKYNKDYQTINALYAVSMYCGNTHTQAIENIEEFLGRSK